MAKEQMHLDFDGGKNEEKSVPKKAPYQTESEKLAEIRANERKLLQQKPPGKTLEQIRKEEQGKPTKVIEDEFLNH